LWNLDSRSLDYVQVKKTAMSSTQLELLRVNQELTERLEVFIGDELDCKPNGVRSFRLLTLIIMFLIAKTEGSSAASTKVGR
jgi:hypothetical protein